MNKIVPRFRMCTFSVLMVLIILNPKTSVISVANSMELCLKSVIPGVFPFIFLGSAIASELRNVRISVLEHLLRIPTGSAGFLLIGFLCGYPVGAKLLQDAANRNHVPKESAIRMISFCNNASPAFIIGILSSLFSNAWAGVAMWCIQILSSLILGIVLPGNQQSANNSHEKPPENIGMILKDAITALASICGWVIIFGLCIAYINAAIEGLNSVQKVIICGAIELTNGIFLLSNIQSDAVRFILSSILLSFGGLCVLLQTLSVAPSANPGAYLRARALHAAISAVFSSLTALIIFPCDVSTMQCLPLFLCTAILGCIIALFNKKMVAIQTKV